jgi:hypothetical protein
MPLLHQFNAALHEFVLGSLAAATGDSRKSVAGTGVSESKE